MSEKNAPAPAKKFRKSAKRIREALERLGMTQVGFAAEIQMGDRHIRKFCAGECEVPKIVWMAIELLELKRHTESS